MRFETEKGLVVRSRALGKRDYEWVVGRLRYDAVRRTEGRFEEIFWGGLRGG